MDNLPERALRSQAFENLRGAARYGVLEARRLRNLAEQADVNFGGRSYTEKERAEAQARADGALNSARRYVDDLARWASARGLALPRISLPIQNAPLEDLEIFQAEVDRMKVD